MPGEPGMRQPIDSRSENWYTRQWRYNRRAAWPCESFHGVKAASLLKSAATSARRHVIIKRAWRGGTFPRKRPRARVHASSKLEHQHLPP